MTEPEAVMDQDQPADEEDWPTETRQIDKKQDRCQKIKRLIWSLCVGQLLAGLLGASNISLALLAAANVSLPLSQMAPQYALVGVTFGLARLFLICTRRRSNSNHQGGSDASAECTFKKLLLTSVTGIVDMHSHWATLYAFAYTNVTSIQLLDCLAVPTSMFLSFLVLKHRYLWTHYVGAFVCVLGSALMVVADVFGAESNSTNSTDSSQQDVIFGDTLAISGAALYGVASVLQEYTILHCGTMGYLSVTPIIAALLASTFAGLLEREQLVELFQHHTIYNKPVPPIAILYFFGYLATMSFLDAMIGFTVTRMSAVLINLSLLAADIYALLAGIGLFQLQFHWLYFLAFAFILTGSALFAVKEATPDPTI